MKCKNMKILLSAYADNELSKEDKDFIDEHVKSCKSCLNELEYYKKINKLLLYNKENVEPAPFFETRLFSRINQKNSDLISSMKDYVFIAKKVACAGIGFLIILLILFFTLPDANKNQTYEEVQDYVLKNNLNSFEKKVMSESKVSSDDIIDFAVYAVNNNY